MNAVQELLEYCKKIVFDTNYSGLAEFSYEYIDKFGLLADEIETYDSNVLRLFNDLVYDASLYEPTEAIRLANPSMGYFDLTTFAEKIKTTVNQVEVIIANKQN